MRRQTNSLTLTSPSTAAIANAHSNTMSTATGPAAAPAPSVKLPSAGFAATSAELDKQRVLNGHDLDNLERAQPMIKETTRTRVKSPRRTEKVSAGEEKPHLGGPSCSPSRKEGKLRIVLISENLFPKVCTAPLFLHSGLQSGRKSHGVYDYRRRKLTLSANRSTESPAPSESC